MTKKITKNLGGRPTKYLPDIIHPKVDEYLEMCSREQTKLPSIEGLSLFLGVHRDTIFDWAKKKPGFSDYLEKVAAKQKEQLIDDGMYGGKEVNASMAIFLLKAIHGMKDGHETNVNITVKPILGGATQDAEVIEDGGDGR